MAPQTYGRMNIITVTKTKQNGQNMIFICMDQRFSPLLLLPSCIFFQLTTPLIDLSIRLTIPPSVYLFFVSDAYGCFLVMPLGEHSFQNFIHRTSFISAITFVKIIVPYEMWQYTIRWLSMKILPSFRITATKREYNRRLKHSGPGIIHQVHQRVNTISWIIIT